MRINPTAVEQIDSPISTTYAMLEQRTSTGPVLSLAQAAPTYPPAPEVAEHVAATAMRPDGSGYVEIAGLPKLREAFAAELRADYAGTVDAADVVITAGCNQAFCLTVNALAERGDEVIVPLPYYFNHDMWLRLTGVRPVYLEPGPGMVPTVEAAEAAITDRTRAILLVTPGNPTGVTVEPATIHAFATLARSHDIALIVDETYRSFRATTEPAHALFADPGWTDTVVSLHSFSKDLAIPGYRVGAVVAGAALTRQIEKLLDCVAICATRIGQEAAWAGVTMAGEWRAARAKEIAEKQVAFEAAMRPAPGGFELVSCGAYFGWIRHPFPQRSTRDVVRELIHRHDVLVIPGTAFLPDDRHMLRASFANLEPDQIAEFARRLAAFGRSS
ncbi:aminotransferase [Actinomycetes bacterium KLBMP 9759]